MRTERDWSQAKAGEILGKGQNALSRLESPTYGKLTIQTLLEIARGYDVGLIVKFVPYSRLVKEYEDVSFDALSAPSPTKQFPDELKALSVWVDEDEDDGFWEADKPQEGEDIEETVDSNVVTSVYFASEPVEQAESGHYSLYGYLMEVPPLEVAQAASAIANSTASFSSIGTSAGRIRKVS